MSWQPTTGRIPVFGTEIEASVTVGVGTLKNPHCKIGVSSEHRPIFEALHRLSVTSLYKSLEDMALYKRGAVVAESCGLHNKSDVSMYFDGA